MLSKNNQKPKTKIINKIKLSQNRRFNIFPIYTHTDNPKQNIVTSCAAELLKGRDKAAMELWRLAPPSLSRSVLLLRLDAEMIASYRRHVASSHLLRDLTDDWTVISDNINSRPSNKGEIQYLPGEFTLLLHPGGLERYECATRAFAHLAVIGFISTLQSRRNKSPV